MYFYSKYLYLQNNLFRYSYIIVHGTITSIRSEHLGRKSQANDIVHLKSQDHSAASNPLVVSLAVSRECRASNGPNYDLPQSKATFPRGSFFHW